MIKPETNKTEIITGLGELLRKGGIYYSVPGNNVRDALESCISKIQLPDSIAAETLLDAVLEREMLMSTSLGNGIAIPHPRNPLIVNPENQFCALAFLDNPVDWKSLDGNAVDTIFMIVSSSAKFHLHTLSIISYLCTQDSFIKHLRERSSEQILIQYINETENKWK